MPRATCYRCLRPSTCCVCALVPRVRQRTRIIVVQHPNERRHPFGTVRLARLGLANMEVHLASRDAEGRTVCPEHAPPGAALLYPSAEATDLAELEMAPSALVVVDGTWSTARKVVRDNAWLRALPRVKVTPPRRGNYRIRAAPDPSRHLSTIEAIAYALGILERDAPGIQGLLTAFDTMIDRQIALEQRHRDAR